VDPRRIETSEVANNITGCEKPVAELAVKLAQFLMVTNGT
jgi:hypothetical protein